MFTLLYLYCVYYLQLLLYDAFYIRPQYLIYAICVSVVLMISVQL